MTIKVFSEIEKRGHEQVVFFHYPEVGLKAIVAVHNSVLGPALGGCRMRPYQTEEQAIDDVLRLSEGMTYKSSVADLDLGGGKAVIMADPNLSKGRRELFLKFAECLESLSGRYITAEDMGTSVKDIEVMREVTKYATGYSMETGGSGDPSPWTALGVFRGIMAACELRYGSSDLQGKKIAVQGVGHVGEFLVEHLVGAGAIVTACDTNKPCLERVAKRFKLNVVDVDKIYDVDCDIYSPNAIGQTVNHETLKRLKCDIIAGGANNQLIDSSVYEIIAKRGMMYCPDFVINGGGITSIASEFVDMNIRAKWLRDKVEKIGNTVRRVLEESLKRDKFPEIVAVELAKERIEKKRLEQFKMCGNC